MQVVIDYLTTDLRFHDSLLDSELTHQARFDAHLDLILIMHCAIQIFAVARCSKRFNCVLFCFFDRQNNSRPALIAKYARVVSCTNPTVHVCVLSQNIHVLFLLV